MSDIEYIATAVGHYGEGQDATWLSHLMFIPVDKNFSRHEGMGKSLPYRMVALKVKQTVESDRL